ncbi:hypothetical protein EVU96_09260 [Bacillus infantis]|uniref:RNA dependent RNA polymerase n=1 Tax=Bacillus infantis TaxID=324767 RepID=UPI00101D18FE|nr:hypothetical protein [Bacillus infantis]RYI30593.1 hypothetical protein EVU96_09260 [Bacillus infantis]
MIKLQQYSIFKITTSRLLENKFNIPDFSVQQARLNGELVQIGDNQVFRMIRKVLKKETDIERLNNLISKRDEIKSLPSSSDNSKLINSFQQQIDEMLFVADIINVKVDDKKVYKEICKNGFRINNIHFSRFCSGAGQSRRNTASFINTELKEELDRRLNCGLKVKKINVAKYNAYFGLYMSATYPVRTPRVCLIDDCEEFKLPKTVDWISDVEESDENGNKKTRRVINEKQFDFVPNMWDGQGLISPSFARQWQEDLEIDYLPSQYGIRSSFIKGMLSVFDFHKFAKTVAKTGKITDFYGDTWDIKDIDILLSISQFKMYKQYQSWEQFIQLQEHHGHSWGVTKVSPKVDREMSLLNYQYIQTLRLDRQTIRELIKPTTTWIDKICSGDKLSTLLFLLGTSDKNETVTELLDKTNSNFTKAILYNDKLLNDPYIKKKIYESISTKIKDAKIGRLWARGNYQCMVSDPYGQAQWAFKMNVTGLLNEHEHYSRFWNEREVKKVDACRSPMVDFHEHNILNFKTSDDTEEWFKYQDSGIIYNIWGVDTIRHSDSDWDYDIVFTTDNEIILNSIYPDQNVITYDKESAPNQTLNNTNLMKTDLRSFDSKIGAITNYSTTFIAMLANFKEGSPEYEELLTRIKLLRRYIGDSIDQAKGIKMKPFPSEWKKREFLYEDDSEEVKQQKYYRNSLIANRKPYFMIYVYDRVMNEYRDYKKKCERTCKEKFGCTLTQLLSNKNKTKQESYYVSEYYRRMPVIKNSSVMNMLCSMVEEVDFKYKRPKNNENVDEMFDVLFNYEIGINEGKLEQLVELYKKFTKRRSFKIKNSTLNAIDYSMDQENEKEKLINEFYEEIRTEAYSICSNEKELANHLIYIVYKMNPDDSKDFAWQIGIDGLLEILKDKSDLLIEMPFHDKNGTDYLGKKYSLQGVVV